VITYAGGRFTGEPEALRPVVQELAGRGLTFVDDGASPRSRTGEVAGRAMPYARADLVIDGVLDRAAISSRLVQLEAIARQRGYAIGSANAFPITIDALRDWARTAEERGFELVPVTALANDPGASPTVLQVP
jgi:uncharacterized protein